MTEQIDLDHAEIKAHLDAQDGMPPGTVRLADGTVVPVGSHNLAADHVGPDAP